MLQLLDLVQVVNESLADLFNEQRPVCNLVLNLLPCTVVRLRVLAHLLGSEGLGELAGAFESSLVANKSGGALDALL